MKNENENSKNRDNKGEIMQRLMDKLKPFIEPYFREKMGIPDMSNPKNLEDKAHEIKSFIDNEVIENKKYVKENLKEVYKNYKKFKNLLSFYNEFIYYLETKEEYQPTFIKSPDTKNSSKIWVSLRRFKEQVLNLATIFTHQTLHDKGMSNTTSDDYNSLFDGSKKQYNNQESEKIDYLKTGKGHQITTSNELQYAEEETLEYITKFIDKYISGDGEKDFLDAYQAIKTGRKINPFLFASLRAIKEEIKKIEKQNEIATRLGVGYENSIILEKNIPYILYTHFLCGCAGSKKSKKSKKFNYYRKKHLYAATYFDDVPINKVTYELEARYQLMIGEILSEWKKLDPSNINNITLDNYYRTMFISSLIYNNDGYTILDAIRRDLFGRWIRTKNDVKRSKIWTFLQDSLYRENKPEKKEEDKFLPKINKEICQQIIDKFGQRDYAIYYFRKIRHCGLTNTVKEVHKLGGKISKKSIDPITATINAWLKTK